jgi:hypothetical protein
MLTDNLNKSILLHKFYYGFVILMCYDGSEVTFKEFNGHHNATCKADIEQLLNDNVAVYIVQPKLF